MLELDPTIAEALIAVVVGVLSWIFGFKKGKKSNG